MRSSKGKTAFLVDKAGHVNKARLVVRQLRWLANPAKNSVFGREESLTVEV